MNGQRFRLSNAGNYALIKLGSYHYLAHWGGGGGGVKTG